MTRDEPVPFRLGFFLERTGVACCKWPHLPYRGIDRLPYLPSFEEQDDLRAASKSKLADLWDRYWDAKDTRQLMVNLQLAQDLKREFCKEGIELEVVYAEIAMIPDNLDEYPSGKLWSEEIALVLPHWRHIHDRLGERLPKLQFIGFDLSHPVPSFHSAIFQPGLHNTCPKLPDYLNSNGLFDDLNTASMFLHKANEMGYGGLPFCILGIWETANRDIGT